MQRLSHYEKVVQQLIDSGEVYEIRSNRERKDTPELNRAGFKTFMLKWVQKCETCEGAGGFEIYPGYLGKCMGCKGKGYVELSGPTFSSALLIFNRRGL